MRREHGFTLIEVLIVTAIVAIENFTSDNGATRVVPGSHVHPPPGVPKGRDTPYKDEVTVTMPAGSVLLFSGHLYHSGTRNNSKSWRDALQITFARPGAQLYG